MVTDPHREEISIVLLANAGIALDVESIAATSETPVDGWRDAFERLERKGYVEPVEGGLYRLTAEGEKMVLTRGAAAGTPGLWWAEPCSRHLDPPSTRAGTIPAAAASRVGTQ